MLLCGTPISCCEWQTVCTNETCCDCQYYKNTAKVKMLRARDGMLSCWTPISCCEWQINCTNETCGDCHHDKNKSKRKNKLSAFLKGRSNQSSTHIFTSNKRTEVFYRKMWRRRGKGGGGHKHEWTLQKKKRKKRRKKKYTLRMHSFAKMEGESSTRTKTKTNKNTSSFSFWIIVSVRLPLANSPFVENLHGRIFVVIIIRLKDKNSFV